MAERLSHLEVLILLVKTVSIFPSKLLLNLVRNCVYCWRRGLPTRSYLTIASIRALLTTFSPREIQAVVLSTQKSYQEWVNDKKGSVISCSSALPASNGAIHWIGADPDRVEKNSKLILFFHGGGYAVPLGTAHLDWCWEHVQVGHAKGLELGIAMLEYSLCPGASYPTQLQQAAEALKYVLDVGYRPENIIIGGDSAGGNLTFALLGHLLHPHPAAIPVSLDRPLAGAFGISPWVTSAMNTTSFRQNSKIDMLSPTLIRQSRRDFLSRLEKNSEVLSVTDWALPMDNVSNWWSGLDGYVHNLFLNTGRQEMMHDHVLAFGQVLSREGGKDQNITVDIGEVETHDHILADFMAHKVNGRSFNALMQWMLEAFGSHRTSKLESQRYC